MTLSPYARVCVQNGQIKIETLALLDTGCETSLITQALADELRLKGPTRRIRLGTFHGNDPTTLIRLSSCRISSCTSSSSFEIARIMIVPDLRVAARYVDWPQEKKRWSHLADLSLEVFDSKQVGVFIGANVVGALLQLELRAPNEGIGPYGLLTPFGWTVMGEVPAALNSVRSPACYTTSVEEDGHDIIEQFWLFESFGSRLERAQYSTEQEKLAIQILSQTIRYLGDRYEIGLPWASEKVKLPDNRKSALRRLYSTESRFRSDKKYAERYTKAIEVYMKMGFARRLRMEELVGVPGRTWYLPHFLVINPNKPDKPRLVFDAASKHDGVCLNDALINGPLLLSNLHDLLILFREGPYAVSMDIEKMFLQVRVREEDQYAFRFLWRRPGDEGPPVAYQMMVEIFGAASSPTSCTFVLRRTAEDNLEYQDIKHKVTENFYVDNYLDSFNDAATAIDCCNRISALLKKGGFVLTHLMTSSREVWQSMEPEKRAQPTLNVDLDDLPVERTLGLLWDGESDTFYFSFSEAHEANTKRAILAAVSSVYDPLGFLACVTLTSKILLQDIWRCGRDDNPKTRKTIGWDELLPLQLQKRWGPYAASLEHLKSLRIARCLRPITFVPEFTKYQLHVFCDASTRGYGAIVYLRAKCKSVVSVQLVTARSRVAPVRQLTIPRLELMGAVLGYRLGLRTKKALRVDVDSTTWWTDSSTVLHWLRAEATLFSAFVANRKEEIREGSLPSEWRHVPGSLNPADDGSRGIPATELNVEHRWFEGPEFLKKNSVMWPAGSEPIPDEDALEIVHSILVGVITAEELEIDRIIVSSTDLPGLERGVAELDQVPGPFSVERLRTALEKCVRRVQGKCFEMEINALQKGLPLPRNSHVLKLSPFLDDPGVLRVGGRLENAPLEEDAIHPMLLPTHHPFTRLVILDAHERCLHSQIDRTLYEVQSRFWIIRGGRAVHDEVRKCLECRKRLAKPLQPFMAPLPVARLTPDLPPFTHVGVDYFGPLYVTVGRRTEKRYGCLFTCLVTRAIHTELAVQLDADSFLMAFRRFVSIRGHPKEVFSDNGTNLVAGERELRIGLLELEKEGRVFEKLAEMKVHWHFSPPSAPHFGGVWERLVRSAKTALRAVLGTQTVREEVLSTTLREVDSMLNARPLTHLRWHPGNRGPLTPNHFLLGQPHPHIPPGLFSDTGELSRRRWLRAQELAQQFWKRWLREYVPSLIERTKWTRKERNVQIGDVVLIVDEKNPRGLWPTGRVSKVLMAQSGKNKSQTVRTVIVKTKEGEFRRPAVKLCLLSPIEEQTTATQPKEA